MLSVEQQQCLLGALGYYQLRRKDGTLAVDGLPGPSTTAAIRQFQLEHRERPNGTYLFVDGAWGPATEAAMREAIGYDEPSQIEVPYLPDISDGDIEKSTWDFLISKGFPAAAAAGIMGNLDAESAMRPENLEDYYQAKLGYTDKSYTQAVDSGSYARFVNDQAGYGLAQWTWHARKRGLLEAAKKAGKSIADLGVQLDYLWQELSTQYSGMVQRLKNKDITVYDATRLFMIQFENPADKSEAAVQRRVGISEIYLEAYSE